MTELPARIARRTGPIATASPPTSTTGPDGRQRVSESTLVGVLGALGVPAVTEDERAARWRPTTATTGGAACRRRSSPGPDGRRPFWVHVTHGDPVGRVDPAGGRHRCAPGLRQLENNTPPYDLDGRSIGEATFELPADLPLGYHRLHVQAGELDVVATLIVAPDAAACPPRSVVDGPGAWPPSSTASDPRSPGASAI